MRREWVVLPLGVAISLQGCGLVAGFGPERTLAQTGDGGTGAVGPGGSGGHGGTAATGGLGGGGGTGGSTVPPHFCDPDGDVVWLQTFGDAAYDALGRIAAAPGGGIYATGIFQGEIELGQGPLLSEGNNDFFAARFDGDGQLLWANRYGGSLNDNWPPTPIRHPAGVVVHSTSKVPLDMGDGEHVPAAPSAAFVTLLSTEGAHLWTTWLDGPGDTFALEAAVDPTTAEVVVFAAFNGQLQLDGELLDSNGGSNDVVLVRLDATDGAILDSFAFGGPSGDWARGIEIGGDGRIYIAGSTQGGIDFGEGPEPSAGGADSYAAVLTADFDFVWTRAYAEEGYQHFRHMVLAPDGDMIAVGMMDEPGTVDLGSGPVYGNRAAYFARISSDDGHIVNGTMIEGIDGPERLAVDADGNVVLAGEYEDTLVLGTETFHSVDGLGDALVFELSPDFANVNWRSVVAGSDQNEGFRDVIIGDDGNVVVSGVFYDELPIEGCGVRRSAGDADAVLFKRRK
jgi:hypothetical protein